MSYTIIRQTKIVKLNDGRLIHFDRSGCNNDTAGREKNIFQATLYESEDEFYRKATEYIMDGVPYRDDPDGWTMKIASRPATLYDYGEHLLRMLKRAESEDSFVRDWRFYGNLFRGIEVLEPVKKIYYGEDAEKALDDLTYREGEFKGVTEPIKFRYLIDTVTDMSECVKIIEKNLPIEFFICRRYQEERKRA